MTELNERKIEEKENDYENTQKGITNTRHRNIKSSNPEAGNIGKLHIKDDNDKKYGLFLFIFSVIMKMLTVFNIIFAIACLVFGYIIRYHKQDREQESFGFDVIPAREYKIESLYTDPVLLSTILRAKKSSEKISEYDEKNDETNHLENWNRERFVLISGVPGSGKSFTARSIIGTFDESYYVISMEPSKLRGKYLGESEKNLESVFKYIDKNRKDKKFIIFFDECDLLLESTKYKDDTERDSTIVHQFLLTSGGDDRTIKLPFICIFITNMDEQYIGERCHRRFVHVSPKLMSKQSLQKLLKKFEGKCNKFTHVDQESKNLFKEIFNQQPLQFPIDFLKELEKSRNIKEDFSKKIRKMKNASI